MPFYDYECLNKKCMAFKKVYTIQQSMSEIHNYKCPECSKQCRRILYPTPDIWACNGAHKTDYPSK